MNRVKTSKTLRHSEYYDMTETFDRLYEASQNQQIFVDIMSVIMSDENIMLAYRNIKKNKGSNTKGTDKQTIQNIELMSEKEFVKKIKDMFCCYTPKPVKRVNIPKPNGKLRPLGIPTIWDRIIQQCVLQVLEPICEAKFHNNSYGFRPNRSAHHAIAQCYRLMNQSKLQYVVDIDIKSFFDNVNHAKLIRQMWTMGIRDKHLLGIIRAMLHAPIILTDGKIEHPKKGTPQGGILSPLLSNIVLNELDWWIASQWEEIPTKSKSARVLDRRDKGKGIDKGNKYKELRKSTLKEIYIVRYADDFKIFCRKRKDADKIFHAVIQWLKQRLSLDISEEKSKIVNLRKQKSEFLGFEMKLVRKADKYVVQSHMSKKAMNKAENNLKEQIKRIQHPANDREQAKEISIYNSMIVGIHNYYNKATLIAFDCSKVNYIISNWIDNRLNVTKQGAIQNKYLSKKYGKSQQIRWLNNCPIIPIGYVKHSKAISIKNEICKFTPKGRELIHKSLDIDVGVLVQLMKNPILDMSVEYNDNRISKYTAQLGRCAVLGVSLSFQEIHCHHIKPISDGGTDKFQNLIIVHESIHKLIHATSQEIISKITSKFKLNKKQISKINALRIKVNNGVITV